MTGIRAAWHAGVPALGRWQGPLDPESARRLGGRDYDFVMLDFENRGWDLGSFPPVCGAAGKSGLDVMARVPVNDPALVAQVLTAGAAGVVVPMVDSAREAAAVVEAARSTRRPSIPGGDARGEEAPVCVVMVETAHAWHDLEAIVATPGVDAVMIGQVDLAHALGWPLGDGPGINIARHEQARAALAHVVEVAERHGKHAAAAGPGDDEDVLALLRLGVGWYGAVEPEVDDAPPTRRASRWRQDLLDAGGTLTP